MKYDTFELTRRYPELEKCKDDIVRAFNVMKDAFCSGNKLLIAGNGGSCSDSEHIAGELLKGFKKKRPVPDWLAEKLRLTDPLRGEELSKSLQMGLPTLVLSNHQSLNTAFANDVENGGLLAVSQQLNVFGKEGDVFLAISTSGNAKNLIFACITAKALGMKTVALTGKDGGELKKLSDISIVAPSTETFVIQEYHLPIYHCLCLMLENYFFDN